jgi:pimeloyl-ACP methyl ester carboxylesterase
MKKWLIRITIILGILIICFYVFALVFIRLNETSMAFVGANLDANERLKISTQVSVPWDTVRVTTSDSVRILLLESRLVEGIESEWVIYFYGRAGQLLDDKNSAMYKLFRDVGLNVLALEYRGYGASEKKQPTESGIYADARSAWRYLNETNDIRASRVLLYGFSLGGAVAIQLATEISPAGLITEGAFSSSLDWGSVHYPWMPKALAGLVIRNRFENLEKAKTLALPWLLFHGRRDSTTPFSHAEALASTTAGARYLVPLECGHNNAIEIESDRMELALTEYLSNLFGLEYNN